MEEEYLQKVIEQDVSNMPTPLVWAGHLVIEGNIIQTKIQVRGNLIGMGNCERAEIDSSSGNIFMLYGSAQNNIMKAKKTVFLKYCENSKIEAGEDIVIENHIMNSELIAGRRVISETPKGKIIGGTVKAKEGVSVYQLGNERVMTTIEVESEEGIIEVQQLSSKLQLKIGLYQIHINRPTSGGKIHIQNGKFYVSSEDRSIPLL